MAMVKNGRPRALRLTAIGVGVGLLIASCANAGESAPGGGNGSAGTVPTPRFGEISTATIPPWVPTPPPLDVDGNPPPGWEAIPTEGGGLRLEPVPTGCPYVRIKGADICVPEGAAWGATTPGICEDAKECGPPVALWKVGRDKSVVRWQSYDTEEGMRVDELLEWSVAPEDKAAFADLHKAFYGE
jgi:hypothetical protein